MKLARADIIGICFLACGVAAIFFAVSATRQMRNDAPRAADINDSNLLLAIELGYLCHRNGVPLDECQQGFKK